MELLSTSPDFIGGGMQLRDSACVSCCGCGSSFTILNRRHHCRICGYIFCEACSCHHIRPETVPKLLKTVHILDDTQQLHSVLDLKKIKTTTKKRIHTQDLFDQEWITADHNNEQNEEQISKQNKTEMNDDFEFDESILFEDDNNVNDDDNVVNNDDKDTDDVDKDTDDVDNDDVKSHNVIVHKSQVQIQHQYSKSLPTTSSQHILQSMSQPSLESITIMQHPSPTIKTREQIDNSSSFFGNIGNAFSQLTGSIKQTLQPPKTIRVCRSCYNAVQRVNMSEKWITLFTLNHHLDEEDYDRIACTCKQWWGAARTIKRAWRDMQSIFAAKTYDKELRRRLLIQNYKQRFTNPSVAICIANSIISSKQYHFQFPSKADIFTKQIESTNCPAVSIHDCIHILYTVPLQHPYRSHAYQILKQTNTEQLLPFVNVLLILANDLDRHLFDNTIIDHLNKSTEFAHRSYYLCRARANQQQQLCRKIYTHVSSEQQRQFNKTNEWIATLRLVASRKITQETQQQSQKNKFGILFNLFSNASYSSTPTSSSSTRSRSTYSSLTSTSRSFYSSSTSSTRSLSTIKHSKVQEWQMIETTNEFRQLRDTHVYLPGTTRYIVQCVYCETMAVLDSSSIPVIFKAKLLDTKTNTVVQKTLMIKTDPQFWNDVCVLNVHEHIYQQEPELQNYMTLYYVCPLASDVGLVMFVDNASTLDDLNMKNKDIFRHYVDTTPSHTSVGDMKIFFRRSVAFSCIMALMLGYGDRHLGNLVIANGRLFHIDYGFLLSNEPDSKRFVPTPHRVRTTPEILNAIGQDYYEEFLQECTEINKQIRQCANATYWILFPLTKTYVDNSDILLHMRSFMRPNCQIKHVDSLLRSEIRSATNQTKSTKITTFIFDQVHRLGHSLAKT